MKRTFLIVTLALGCAASALAQTHKAQTSTSASSDTSAHASAQGGQRNVEIVSGTRLAAQLQNTLDVRRAHVGDQVVLKTTEAIKQNGHTMVNKGARLIGHVTEVQQRAQGNAESRIGLVFDRLESGSLTTPISATITSITQATTHTSASNDDFTNDTSASSTTTTSTSAGSSSGGGLLGGVGNTVGGVMNTVGGVVNTTTQATGQVVSGTTSAVGRTVGGLHISQSGSASAEGGSTLSLTGGNLRLEKNTTFNLTLNESAAVGHERDDREP
ncbi:MAG: hypothetical protein DMF64_09120 [Acidobacteria bacterium]|nr:MAG: hypothetical protein DMF64_09120 [Acidobacteriota bacterium]